MSNQKLSDIVEKFFDNVNKFIISNLDKAYKENNIYTPYRKEYDAFVNYCIRNPTKIFNAIDYVYPHLKKNDSVVYIKALKLGFNDKKDEINKYLTNYEDNIKRLLMYQNISDAVYILLRILLIDLHKYHNIHVKEDDKDLKKLLEKEYCHRQLNKIKNNK